MTNSEIDAKIRKLNLKQEAYKLLLNSYYGASGNPWYYFANPDIAQSITLQGQDLIKFSIQAVNHYFLNKWHLDKELHEHLGISQYTINKVEDEAAIYTDTDSVDASTMVRTKKFSNIKISDWYDLNEENGSAGMTEAGHESVETDDLILNWDDRTQKLEYHPVRRIIRHMVFKDRWQMMTDSGNHVNVTGDHSLIVFRNKKKLEVKPQDVKIGDDVLEVLPGFNADFVPSFAKVVLIEKLHHGFSGEYVYDVEVDHETHTFIANDILVHNSIYVQFDSAMQSIQGATFTRDEEVKMCVEIDRLRLASYFDQCFQKYAKLFNTKNRLKFKLENVSEYGIWLKKKNYALQIAYSPNKDYTLFPKDKRKLLVKGLETVKSSYPIWAREKLLIEIKYLLEVGKAVDLERDVIPRIKKIKEDFDTLSIDEVAFNFNVRVYNKYIEDIRTLSLTKGVSAYARAAAVYNHLLIKNDLVGKYSSIREKDKIKFYYCIVDETNPFESFAYSPGTFPTEIAPAMDRDLQFFSLIVEPINRIMFAMKVGQIDEKLKRRVNVVATKVRRILKDDEKFPLHVIDQVTLEHQEVPEKFWWILGDPDAQVSEDDTSEYLGLITTYGLNTVIVPNFELPKFIAKVNRKKERLEAKLAAVEGEEDESDED